MQFSKMIQLKNIITSMKFDQIFKNLQNKLQEKDAISSTIP